MRNLKLGLFGALLVVSSVAAVQGTALANQGKGKGNTPVAAPPKGPPATTPPPHACANKAQSNGKGHAKNPKSPC
ncbi:MAG: hypothetical protein ACK4K7_08300 [Allosphingosinicella sp.]|uniref:hypothetical protein n=1 Tax=Allosphingosinicella sp. TaxID=2823234 RepID=UPI003955121A